MMKVRPPWHETHHRVEVVVLLVGAQLIQLEGQSLRQWYLSGADRENMNYHAAKAYHAVT